ncbi:MAG: hypothetical protein ACK528_01745 [Alphaproteobacteria bacterium]
MRQPDRAANAARKHRSYTTLWGTIGNDARADRGGAEAGARVEVEAVVSAGGGLIAASAATRFRDAQPGLG